MMTIIIMELHLDQSDAETIIQSTS